MSIRRTPIGGFSAYRNSGGGDDRRSSRAFRSRSARAKPPPAFPVARTPARSSTGRAPTRHYAPSLAGTRSVSARRFPLRRASRQFGFSLSGKGTPRPAALSSKLGALQEPQSIFRERASWRSPNSGRCPRRSGAMSRKPDVASNLCLRRNQKNLSGKADRRNDRFGAGDVRLIVVTMVRDSPAFRRFMPAIARA